MDVAETRLWEGHPGHSKNFGIYIACILLCWLVVPIVYGLWKAFALRFTHYELTTERLRLRTGIFSRSTSELELYRIKDTALLEPFVQRIFGAGTVVINSSDRMNPYIELQAIPGADVVREQIRTHVERLRILRGTREVDFDQGN